MFLQLLLFLLLLVLFLVLLSLLLLMLLLVWAGAVIVFAVAETSMRNGLLFYSVFNCFLSAVYQLVDS